MLLVNDSRLPHTVSSALQRNLESHSLRLQQIRVLTRFHFTFSFSGGLSVSLPERIFNKQEFTITGHCLSGSSCGTEMSVAGNTFGALSGCRTGGRGIVVWNLC